MYSDWQVSHANTSRSMNFMQATHIMSNWALVCSEECLVSIRCFNRYVSVLELLWLYSFECATYFVDYLKAQYGHQTAAFAVNGGEEMLTGDPYFGNSGKTIWHSHILNMAPFSFVSQYCTLFSFLSTIVEHRSTSRFESTADFRRYIRRCQEFEWNWQC
jgi:hypothetical protein